MKFLDPKDALALGIVQEVNRLFLHPLGLALGVREDDITGIRSFYMWDSRNDPEGIYFSPDLIDKPETRTKAARIQAMLDERAAAREAALGYVIQPIPGADPA